MGLDGFAGQVSGETQHFHLTAIQEVALGEQAVTLLQGCLSSKPPSRICALKMKDGHCISATIPLRVGARGLALIPVEAKLHMQKALVIFAWFQHLPTGFMSEIHGNARASDPF